MGYDGGGWSRYTSLIVVDKFRVRIAAHPFGYLNTPFDTSTPLIKNF
jgi:hypothetical protein